MLRLISIKTINAKNADHCADENRPAVKNHRCQKREIVKTATSKSGKKPPLRKNGNIEKLSSKKRRGEK